MDTTELYRREMIAQINSRIKFDDAQRELVRLREIYGENNVFDTTALQENFEVRGFLAPFCSVTRKKDNVNGILTFQHHPRFYFDFQPK